ncbi:hypothetical protein D9M71_580000 [compost metagenome]
MAGNIAPVQAPRLFGEPGDEAGRVVDLAARLEQRLALLQRQNLRQVLAMLQDQLAPAAQDGSALVEAALAPGREGGVGGIHRGDDLLALQQRYVAYGFAGGGILHGDAGAAGAVQPVAVHVAQRLEQQGVGVGHGGVSVAGGLETMLGGAAPRFFPKRGAAAANLFADGPPTGGFCGRAQA